MGVVDDRVSWLFLDLNSYFASVEQQERPELRGRAVGVVPVVADTTVLIAASYEAKAFGVKTGTRVAEAKALCPGIQLVPARHSIYVRYHHQVVAAVDSCVPVEAVASIDEMVCRLTGSQREPDAAVALAQKVKATVKERVGECLRSSVGLAPSRYLAKVASDMQKPDGLTLLRPSDLPQRLYPLAVRELPGIGPKMDARLKLRGIRTVEQLCSLAPAQARQLWGGVWGERMALWLRGDSLELEPPKHTSLSHSHVLEPAARNYAEAWRVAKKLVSKLAIRLRKEEAWTTGLSLQLKLVGGGDIHRRERLDESQDTPTFLKALEKLWPEHPDKPPLFVGVAFHPLIFASQHVPSLFDNPKRERLAHVMDTINARHGKHTAFYASLFDTEEKAPTHIAFNRIPELEEFDE